MGNICQKTLFYPIPAIVISQKDNNGINFGLALEKIFRFLPPDRAAV